MQDIFRSVAGSLDRLRREKAGDSFRGWLWRCDTESPPRLRPQASGAGGRRRGSEAHQRLADLPDLQPVCDDPSSAASHAGIVRNALELIRGDYEGCSWQAFWRVAVDGHSPADVAVDHGLSVFAVYQIKCRVTQRLKKELGEFMDE